MSNEDLVAAALERVMDRLDALEARLDPPAPSPAPAPEPQGEVIPFPRPGDVARGAQPAVHATPGQGPSSPVPLGYRDTHDESRYTNKDWSGHMLTEAQIAACFEREVVRPMRVRPVEDQVR